MKRFLINFPSSERNVNNYRGFCIGGILPGLGRQTGVARDIFIEYFDVSKQIEKLDKANLLYRIPDSASPFSASLEAEGIPGLSTRMVGICG